MEDFAAKKYKRIKVFELIIFGTILVLFGLSKTLSMELNKIIGSLALLNVIPYFLMSKVIIEFEDSNPLNSFGRTWVINFVLKLYYYSFMVFMVGIFIYSFKIPNAKLMPILVVSGINLIFCFFAAVYARNTIKSKFYNLEYYMRILLALILIFLTITMPNSKQATAQFLLR